MYRIRYIFLLAFILALSSTLISTIGHIAIADEEEVLVMEATGQEFVYNFSGITSPSSSHTAEDGEIDANNLMIENATFPARRGTGIIGWANWDEASTGDYAALVGSDNNYYQGADPGSGDNAAMIFEFYIDQDAADVEQIELTVELGRGRKEYRGWVYMWNYNTSSYTVIGSQRGAADRLVSGKIAASAGDYIDPNTGQVTIFVVNEDTSDWIRVDGIALSVYAFFLPETNTIIATAGSGGSINPSGDVIVSQGNDQSFTITPDPGYDIADVLVDSVSIGVVPSYTLHNVSEGHTIEAFFIQDGYTLEVSITGNGIVDKFPGHTTYLYGDVITLTAEAGPGWLFSSWTGDLSSSDNAATITMDSDKTITAVFTEIILAAHDLKIIINGNGITSPSIGSHLYNEGTVVDITAIPADGWQFDSWTGDVADPDSASTTVTIDNDNTVTAIFIQATQYAEVGGCSCGSNGSGTSATELIMGWGIIGMCWGGSYFFVRRIGRGKMR